MEKPDLNKMWRTWIKIGNGQPTHKLFQDTIRYKVYRFSELLRKGDIQWFYFLYHNKPDDPANVYYDIVFTAEKDPNAFLPSYCENTKKIPPMEEISGIDKAILKENDITEAWRIIGEQSEFMINLVCAHEDNVEIPVGRFIQFMHFFMNMLGLGNKSLMFTGIPIREGLPIAYLMGLPKTALYFIF